MAVKGAGNAGHRGAHVGHNHLRTVYGQLALHHQRHAAALDGLRRKVMRVYTAAANAEKQAAFTLGTRIRRQGFNLRLRVPRDFDQFGHACRQLFKVHRHSSICCVPVSLWHFKRHPDLCPRRRVAAARGACPAARPSPCAFISNPLSRISWCAPPHIQPDHVRTRA